MKVDKTNPIYKGNPELHLKDLYKFRDRLFVMVLGVEDKEWRGELEFLIGRTNKKITDVRNILI